MYRKLLATCLLVIALGLALDASRPKSVDAKKYDALLGNELHDGRGNPVFAVQKSYTIYLPLVYKSRLEWTFHKTVDNMHPDGNEQQLVWLMNRARANPAQEGLWLATTSEADIAGGRDYFGVNLNVLQSEFASYAVKPPAAFDVRMYNAALAHSKDLIVRDAQDHNNQFTLVDEAGFKCWGGRGNVFSYARSSLYAHAAFNIDWGGNDGTGMQTGRGHRMAIMSVDGDYTNVGFAMVPESNPNTSVGPLVTTENFCRANSAYPAHFNQFIVGTVWQDNNGNARYDPGEGVGDVKVEPNLGEYYAVTANSGGYAIPVQSSGLYAITFSGVANSVVSVTINLVSVLVDLKLPAAVGSKEMRSDIPVEPFRHEQHPTGIRFPDNF
jgi:hypothetical protein